MGSTLQGASSVEAVPQDMIAGASWSHIRGMAVIGAPAYFANRPRPMKPADLMDHECIRTRYPSGALYRWEFERHGEAMKIDVPGSLTLDEPEMIAQASRAGLGLAYVSEWMVADDIASGRLVEVLSEWTPCVSRILPLLSGTPPHGRELARLRRSGPRDCRSESREGVLMDAGAGGPSSTRASRSSRHPAEPVAKPSRKGRYLRVAAVHCRGQAWLEPGGRACNHECR